VPEQPEESQRCSKYVMISFIFYTLSLDASQWQACQIAAQLTVADSSDSLHLSSPFSTESCIGLGSEHVQVN